MNEKPDLGLVCLIVILTAMFAVFITVVDGIRLLSHKTYEVLRKRTSQV